MVIERILPDGSVQSRPVTEEEERVFVEAMRRCWLPVMARIPNDTCDVAALFDTREGDTEWREEP
jgi:hypothetical protein